MQLCFIESSIKSAFDKGRVRQGRYNCFLTCQSHSTPFAAALHAAELQAGQSVHHAVVMTAPSSLHLTKEESDKDATTVSSPVSPIQPRLQLHFMQLSFKLANLCIMPW